jgi:alpha-beta hydrolase superfamily lysophospholipase
MEKVSFETSDGVTIAANYWPGDPGAVLLLHMMPATKESWNNFATQLAADGWTVLAIDLRGHGESTLRQVSERAPERLDYKLFDDSMHQQSRLDIQAAVQWLRLHNTELRAIVGASIGSSLALQYQVEEGFYGKTALLSPGLNYYGIQTQPLAEKLQEPQSLFLAGAKEDVRKDGNNCAAVALELYRLAPIQNKQIFLSDSGAHGTDLFAAEGGLSLQLLKWLAV